MGTPAGRDDLFKVEYVSVSCPDQGDIRLLPYVSAGAMEAYMSADDDPERAFGLLYRASVAKDGPAIEALTKHDVEVVAQFYIESLDCRGEYDSAREAHDVFNAFRSAFSATEIWSKFRRDQKHVNDMLVFTRLQIPGDFLRLTKVAEEVNSGLAKYARSTDSFLSTFNSLPARSLLQQASAALLLPRSTAVSDLALFADNRYRTWNDLAESYRWLEKGIAGIDARMQWIGSLAQQTKTISKWLDPLPRIHDSLVEVTRQIDSSGVVRPDILRLTDGVLRDSAGIVYAANQFFASEYLRGTPVVSPTEAEETELQSLEAAKDVHEANDKSMVLLHQTAEDVIIVGSDTAISLRDEFGVVVDERLKPYKHLLERLSYLASPKSFWNMLKDFREVFSREYWRTIWREPGTRFLPKPESLTKMGLGMYLSGQWNGLAFVGQELANGDGFVDLLVNYMGYNYIVELKIVGLSWSIGTARDGLSQINAYMENYQKKEAYLVVFDGRRTTSGEQLNSEYEMPNGVVKVIVVRTFFDRPSR